MIRFILLFCLGIFLTSCKVNQEDNSEQKKNKTDITLTGKEVIENSEDSGYFSNPKDFKTFISKKWISLDGSVSCTESRSIEITKNTLIDNTGMELIECNIHGIKLINSKTLEIKLEKNCNYGNTFKIELLDFQNKLVKWSFYNGMSYKSKPYDIVCNELSRKESKTLKNSFSEEWEGFYQFSDSREGQDLGEGSDYELYLSQDSVDLHQYGYRHSIHIKCHVIQKEDVLYLYDFDNSDDLLIKIFKENDNIFGVPSSSLKKNINTPLKLVKK